MYQRQEAVYRSRCGVTIGKERTTSRLTAQRQSYTLYWKIIEERSHSAEDASCSAIRRSWQDLYKKQRISVSFGIIVHSL